jgi:hypothetical protein
MYIQDVPLATETGTSLMPLLWIKVDSFIPIILPNLNRICHLLALEAHHILHVGRIRVNNSNTNEDIATKQTHTTDTFLFISHTTKVLLFKSRRNIFIGFRIIKEMPDLIGSGTPCIVMF